MNIENSSEIKLYDFTKTVNQNLFENAVSYILFEVSEKRLEVKETLYPLPDNFSTCLVDMEKLKKQMDFTIAVFDYNSIFGMRYSIFKKYDYNFFACDERVFFEGMLIKYKTGGYTRFNWDLSKIMFELGIKRKRLNSIIKRFISLGIITHKFTSIEGKKKRKSSFNQGTCFNINPARVIELLPQIFADFAIDQVKNDIEKYLKPGLIKQT